MKNSKKGKIKALVLAELMAILVILLVSAALYIGARHQVKANSDGMIFGLNEMLYDYDEPASATREALRTIQTIETSSGYEGNVSAHLIDNSSDGSFWLEGRIAALFYKENGEVKLWNLNEYFKDSEIDTLIDLVTDKHYSGHPIIMKISVKKSETGKEIPAGIEIGYTHFTRIIIGDITDGEMFYDKNDEEPRISEIKLFALPQSEKWNKLLEDEENHTLSNVYRNSVLYNGSMFPGSSKYSVASHSDFPVVVFSIAFDFNKIALDQSLPQMLLAAVFIQTFAIYYMIYFSKREQKREEARRYRDNFIDAVAHELKTPASVIQNTSEYLSTGLRPEKQEHYLEVLKNESGHMNDLLNRMLAYSRVKDGTADIKTQDTELDALVDEAVKSYEESGIIIERVKGGSKVKCDSELIKSVIDNLVSNAVKYGEHDVPVRIVTQGTTLSVWNKVNVEGEVGSEDLWNSMDRIEIKGRGSNGSGVGLAISAVILDKHGASHKAEYKDGGIEFSFDLSGKTPKKYSRLLYIPSIIQFIVYAPLVVYWTNLYMQGGQNGILPFVFMSCWLMLTIWPFYIIVSNSQ
ncbi:MAG: HAMP domain-containing histidine kinase [Saccharofermentans sp.]|nr:HAMP domain-containing histidine kinase [Saccharofermentans sp.]